MSIFLRVVLLCAFAVAGVALAVGVGSSTAPTPPEEKATATIAVQYPEDLSDDGCPPSFSPEIARDRLASPEARPQAAAPATVARSLPEPSPRPTDIESPAPALSVPIGLLAAQTQPARTRQFASGPEPLSAPEIGPPSAVQPEMPTLQEVYDYVRQQLEAESRPPSGQAAPLPPLPEEVLPPSATLPARAPDEILPPPPPVLERIEPPATPAKASIDDEGDGKLAIRIQDADIREVLDLLGEEGHLNILAGSSVKGTVSATLRGVDIPEALAAILKSTGLVARREGAFLFIGTPADFDAIEQTIDGLGTRVYRPNYVSAAELQSLVQPLLTAGTGVVSVSTPAEAGIGSDDSSAGGFSFAGGDVVLVRDYEAVLAQIDQVVAEIDVRPMQVAIEAMILSVKLDDENQFGVNFELLRDKGNVKLGWGDPVSTLGQVTFDTGGLKFGFLDRSLGAFLDALETVGDTSVIATPRVLVLNKHRAEIQIGEEKGYVSTTITETSSSQSVEFLKLGAQLRLRPFISTDGLIRMEIHPELSDGSVDTSSGFTLPNKEVTQVTTNIMVRDGCTVVIGGLMREQLGTTTTQVPLFGSLPVVGFVFRNTLEKTERRELLVLITPHIIYEPEVDLEGEKSAAEFHRREAVIADQMSPLGKRAVGRKYFRMAQSAWAVGDRNAALRYAELSVHFDPMNRAAIDLRSDIWSGRQLGEHSLAADASPPGSAAPLPGPVEGPMTSDLYVDDPGNPTAPLPVTHPLDPGQPGGHTDVVRPRRLQ